MRRVGSKRLFYLYFIITTLGCLFLIVPTLLMPHDPTIFNLVHTIMSPTCHQLTKRSLCYFPSVKRVENCDQYANVSQTTRERIVEAPGKPTGYKFPVCSRCLAIYIGMWLSSFVLLLLGWEDRADVPNVIWFILAIIPLALDGTIQLLTSYTSTNEKRIVTGLLAGVVCGVYLVILLNAMEYEKTKHKKQTKE